MIEKLLIAILFIISLICWYFSWRQFRQKGAPFHNAYLYASEEERKNINKVPLFKKAAVIFLIIGWIFFIDALALLLKINDLYYVVGILMILLIIIGIRK